MKKKTKKIRFECDEELMRIRPHI